MHVCACARYWFLDILNCVMLDACWCNSATVFVITAESLQLAADKVEFRHFLYVFCQPYV